jgi:hypothetical protein
MGDAIRSLSTVFDRPAPALSCKGFVVKELLLVLAAIATGVVGLKVIIQLGDEQHEGPLAIQAEEMFRREVPLGDEFLCLASVTKIAKRASSIRPYYVSRVRFARRNPHAFELFLLDLPASLGCSR